MGMPLRSLFKQPIKSAVKSSVRDSAGIGDFPGAAVMMDFANDNYRAPTTNLISNSTFTGATVGAPGTQPDLHSISVSGLTREILALGRLPDGRPYIDIRFSGVTASNQPVTWLLSTPNIAAVQNTPWAIRAEIAMIGGSTNNVTGLFLRIYEQNNATFLGSFAGENKLPTNALTQYFGFGTTANASTNNVRPMLTMAATGTGVAVDISIRVVAIQFAAGFQVGPYVDTVNNPVTVTSLSGRTSLDKIGGFAVSRTQTGFAPGWGALAEDTDGTWKQFAANTVRRTRRGMLMEEGSANVTWLSDCTLATLGTIGAGAAPPNLAGRAWSQAGNSPSAIGITGQVAAKGVRFGLPYVELYYDGTPTLAQAIGYYFDQTNVAAVSASGQTWTNSFRYEVVEAFGCTAISSIRGRDNSGASVEQLDAPMNLTVGVGLQLAKDTTTFANVNSTRVVGAFLFSPNGVGVPMRLRIRIYAPMTEQKAYATTPIITAGGVGTRGFDFPTLENLPIVTPLTLLVSASMNVLTGVTATLAQIDDTTSGNRLLNYIANGNTMAVYVEAATVSQVFMAGAIPTIGVPFTIAARYQTDNVRGAMNGTLTALDNLATMPAGLKRLSFGGSQGSRWIRRVVIYLRPENDNSLRTLSAVA